LQKLEDAYETLGELIHSLTGAPGKARAPGKPAVKHRPRLMHSRNYVKYPAPHGLRPRSGGPFKVADLCTAYQFPTGLPGGGNIGILELGGGYTQGDLDRFSQLNGLPQIQTTDVPVNGGQNSPGGEADGEVLLDIQTAAAAYFYCTGQMPTINLFFAPNAEASFAAVMSAAVNAGCDVDQLGQR
jgi:hypothetical protein